ncbi:MAG: DUF1549 domain-containing protein [Verrucomicrobiaceae bacterium]|nr:DUF1549 domain-containing protein [Verrucomicrobiaceae bacterium]
MKIPIRGAALALCLIASVATVRSASGNPVETADAVATIDRLLRESFEENQVTPNPVITDEVFVRRIHLDLIGRIPTREETTAFLESTDPAKRAALIDRLIGSEGYQSHLYNYFADLLRVRTNLTGGGQSITAGLAYEQWIKSAIRENKPYDEFVYELVTAVGKVWKNPAIGYTLRDFGMPLDNFAMTSQLFLGTQIVCAQCHNHPFDAMTQQDYYRFAAFTFGLAGVNSHPLPRRSLAVVERRRGEKVPAAQAARLRKAAVDVLFPLRFTTVHESTRPLRLPTDYQYDDAAPRSVVEPSTLFGKEADFSADDYPAIAFGEWLTAPENPRFTKVIVNRLWKRAFGLGLIEPVDDIKDNTVATNAALMDHLEELMIALDYDIRAFLRILYRTDAYQREASLEEPVPGAPYYFPGPLLRRMSAEQIWDSLVAMTVPDPDAPEALRELTARKRVARVRLIGEAVYDQRPGQFLKNLQKVVKVQDQLSVEIDAARAKVVQAREEGDPRLVREATAEARQIRRKLGRHIEETVYRDGLGHKLARISAAPGDRSGSGDSPTEGDTAFLDELAFVFPKAQSDSGEAMASRATTGGGRATTGGGRTMAGGGMAMAGGGMEMAGGDGADGIIDELVDAMFAEEGKALREQALTRRAEDMAAWNIRSQAARGSYRRFNRQVRRQMLRASELRSPAPAGHFLREFGQSDRELIENASDEASVTQSLALLNGPVLNAITHRYSVLSRDMRGETFPDRLDTVYLTLLSRLPTSDEKAIFREAWEAEPESGSLRSIVWTLLNTRQFLFIQ